MRQIPHICAIALAIGLGLSACATPQQFIASTGKFAASTADLADAADLYFGIVDGVKFETQLVRAQANGTPIPKSSIGELFLAPEDLAARQALLATMRSFASSLAKAADQNLGEDFRGEVGGLKGDILTLRNKLDEAKGTELKKLLTDQSLEFGSAVVGAIGQAVIENMQADAIIDAILTAGPAMSNAAGLLAADMDLIFAKLGAEQAIQIALTVDGVNRQLPTAKPKDRGALIKTLRAQRQRLLTSDAIGREFKAALKGYQKALGEMTAFARSKRDPKTIPELVASVEVFAGQTKRLIDLIGKSL